MGVPGGLNALSTHDRSALDDLDTLLAAVRDDLAHTWLREAIALESTIDLVRNTPAPSRIGGTIRDWYATLALGPDRRMAPSGSLDHALEPFAFQDQALKATIASDGFVGSAGGYSTPGTAMNFLVHNMLRLPAGDSTKPSSASSPLGAWQLVRGGMGAITTALADIIQEAGGTILTNTRALEVHLEHGRVRSVELEGVGDIACRTLIIATDPHRAMHMFAGEARLRMQQLIQRVDPPTGTSFKVNMALKALPTVRGGDLLSKRLGRTIQPLMGTVHILPHSDPMARLERGRRIAIDPLHPRLPDPFDAMIDVYTHSAVDTSLCDEHGRHAMSLFVQWFPCRSQGVPALDYAWSLINGPVAAVLPELPSLVEDILPLAPGDIAERFGITGGHIHHVDNGYAFDRRLPSQSPIQGILLAGAGCHPAGSVIGAAGYIAARRTIRDFST